MGPVLVEHLLMELCPLRELLRLSTEPPGFREGFSRECVSGWGEWGQLDALSGLDWRADTQCWRKYCLVK